MIYHHTECRIPKETGWLVDGIVPINGLVVIASAPKTGKSVFANAIARAMATGREFAGMSWQQKIPVGWCAHEETKEERAPLLEGLKDDDPYYLSFPPELPFLDSFDCDYATDSKGRYNHHAIPYVYQQAKQQGVALLVIDCLHAAVRNSNLADNQVARRIMGKLRHWSSSFGIATIVLHHLTKSAHRGYHPERFADSAQILAGASCHFFLESETLEDGRFKVILHGAGRQPAPPPRQEFIAENLFDYKWIEPSAKSKHQTIEQKILNLLEKGYELTAPELAARIDEKVRSVSTIVSKIPGVTTFRAGERRVKYRLNLDALEADADDQQIKTPGGDIVVE